MYHVHIHVRSRKYRYNFIHIDIHIYVGIYVYVYSIYKQIHMHTQTQLQYTQIHNDTQYINKHVYRLEIHMYIVTVPAMGRGGRGPGTVIIYIYKIGLDILVHDVCISMAPNQSGGRKCLFMEKKE